MSDGPDPSEPAQSGHSGDSAWGLRATHRGVRRLMRHAVLASVVAPLVFFVAAAIGGSLPDDSPANYVLVPVCGLALVVFIGGISAIVNNLYLRRVLHRHPWVVVDADFVEARVWWGLFNGQPTLLLGGRDVLSVVTVNWRWDRLNGFDSLWFAGTGGRGGVVSPPGGGDPMRVRPIRFGPLRRYLARRLPH